MKTLVLNRFACVALAYAALSFPAVARAGVFPLPIAGAWDCNVPAVQTRFVLILNHGDSYYTLYGHLSDIAVKVGQEVAAGAVIGRSGDTGSLKGAVLHFEVRRGGTALNPQDWLR